jgi:hypothetical protein
MLTVLGKGSLLVYARNAQSSHSLDVFLFEFALGRELPRVGNGLA